MLYLSDLLIVKNPIHQVWSPQNTKYPCATDSTLKTRNRKTAHYESTIGVRKRDYDFIGGFEIFIYRLWFDATRPLFSVSILQYGIRKSNTNGSNLCYYKKVI